MTRDTKIGLLLGLVFIFIIAFLIQGLPRLRATRQGTDAKMTRAQNTSPGLAARERLVREMTEQSPAMPGSPYTRGMPMGSQPGSQDIRSITPLPGTSLTPTGLPTPSFATPESPTSVASSGSGSTPAGVAVSAQGQTNPMPGPAGVAMPINGVMSVAADTRIAVRPLAPMPGPQAGTLSQPAGNALSPAASTLPSPSTPGVSSGTPAIAGGSQPVVTPQSPAQAVTRAVASDWPKSYVVKDGDSLEAIAKRMYGAGEGVKPASIKRIFEANKGILKSPERLSVGQKLTIPSPAGSTAGASVALQPAAAPKPAVATSSSSQGQRWYTVKEGDSLWKIATAQLGKGTRYQEILKLNANTLKSDEDNLEQGMKLRLPAK